MWRRRCLVLVPVLSFLAAALMMSCGGSSSSSTASTDFASLLGFNVCFGAPPIPTPKPTATNGIIPTVTPTPICSPIVTMAPDPVGTGAGSNSVQFNAQGIFGFANSPATEKFRDITDNNNVNISWNPAPITTTFPGKIFYVGDGEFTGQTTGCTYFTVIAAGFMQSVVVGVNVDPSTCPSPPGAATPSPSVSTSP